MNRTEENAKTLASLMQTTESEAAALLDIEILLTFDNTDLKAVRLAHHVEQMLSRTITRVRNNGDVAGIAELVIGEAPARTNRFLRVVIDRNSIQISPQVTTVPIWSDAHNILLLFASCYAVGRILLLVFGERLMVSAPSADQLFTVPNRDLLGDDTAWIDSDIRLDRTLPGGSRSDCQWLRLRTGHDQCQRYARDCGSGHGGRWEPESVHLLRRVRYRDA